MKREHWSGQFGAIMTIAGGAIGLGSFIAFPTLMQEYSYSAIYYFFVFFLFLTSVPLAIADMIMGKIAQKSAVEAFKIFSPPKGGLRFVGFLSCLLIFLLFSFYPVASGKFIIYTLLALAGKLSPADAKVLYSTIDQSFIYAVAGPWLVVIATAYVVFHGVKDGLEAWSKRLMPLLFALLIAMLVMALFLPEFTTACSMLFCPKFYFDGQMILKALGLTLFILCAGCGVLITSGSYMDKRESPFVVALSTALIMVVVSTMSTLIFSTIALHADIEYSEGSFIFTTLVKLFQEFYCTDLVALLFFATFSIAIITSTVIMLEVLVSNVMEQFGSDRKTNTLIITGATLGTTLLITLFQERLIWGVSTMVFLDGLIMYILFPLSALVSALFIGWRLDSALMRSHFGNSLYRPWLFLIKFVIPAIIVLLFFNSLWDKI